MVFGGAAVLAGNKAEEITMNADTGMKGGAWASIRNKSRRNRMFFDSLVLMVWCECKQGCATKSHSEEEWADIQLPSYSSPPGRQPGFRTPREVLSGGELGAIQDFIDAHEFSDVTDAREQMKPYFGDCITSALNVLV